MKAIILTLSLICILFAKQNENFEIIQPKSKTVFNEAFSSVVVKLKKNSKTKKIQISSKNNTYIIEVKKDRKIYCKTIQLDMGENKYTISLYSEKKLLSKKSVNLFYHSEVFEEGVTIPEGYSKNFFQKLMNDNSIIHHNFVLSIKPQQSFICNKRGWISD